VSLVQPYDGGGMDMIDAMALVQLFTTATGATIDLDLLTVPNDEVFRLLSIGAVRIAGTTYGGSWPEVEGSTAAGKLKVDIERAVGATPAAWTACPKVLAPGTTLSIHLEGGSAPSQAEVRVYGIPAPVGTVFYL